MMVVILTVHMFQVMLAEEKTSSELYAIKVLKKRFIIDNDEVER